jgi:hypothetical protein
MPQNLWLYTVQYCIMLPVVLSHLSVDHTFCLTEYMGNTVMFSIVWCCVWHERQAALLDQQTPMP